MKLYFKKNGEGLPLIILHGLFGSGDNWGTHSKFFAENGFACYLVDQRNHGRSPHSSEFNYDVMSDDILELLNDEQIEKADIIGHSMGGKTAMFSALKFPGRINKMIIADMAPGYYAPHQQAVLAAIHSVDLTPVKTRKEVEAQLRNALSDNATIQFLLKNLYWKNDNTVDWRFAFHEIETNIEETGKGIPENSKINIPTLFLRGEHSGYINQSDEIEIRKIFSSVEIKTISNAGHWLQADNPLEFQEAALSGL